MIEPFFAHQGGWDEILYFVVPAGLAIFGLRWAERRARRRAEAAETAGHGGDVTATGDHSASDGDRAEQSD